jgi:hypothetical protein
MLLQKLEGFSFASALDLNMDYYTIRLDPDASKIYNISPLGQIFLQTITNVHCRFSKIFQSKMSELMESLEYVQAYLDDLISISRNSLEDHIEK